MDEKKPACCGCSVCNDLDAVGECHAYEGVVIARRSAAVRVEQKPIPLRLRNQNQEGCDSTASGDGVKVKGSEFYEYPDKPWVPIIQRLEKEGLWPPSEPALCHTCPLSRPRGFFRRTARWLIDVRHDLALYRQRAWRPLRRFLPRL